jgi:tRNA 2-selenouridine synthase SelU
MKNKTKVLCVCARGRNRSKYLAKYLRRGGYSTRAGGVEPFIIMLRVRKLLLLP